MKAPEQQTETPRYEVFDNKGKIALVDADGFVYKWAAGEALISDKDELIKALGKRMAALKSVINADSYIFLLSGKNNFRNEIGMSRKYKGTRTKSDRPYWFKEVRDWLATVGAVHTEGMEADDGLVMLQSDDTVIVSADKDLLQAGGKFIIVRNNPKNGEAPYYGRELSQAEGFELLMEQSIKGDLAVDNILGIDGVGEVGAKKALKDAVIGNMPMIVLTEYFKKYGIQEGLDRFVETYTLVRMRVAHKDTYAEEKYAYLFEILNLHRQINKLNK